MKFKILPGCELFDKLTAIQSKVQSSKDVIKSTLIEKGYTGEHAQASSHYLLKVDGIEIHGEKPKGWKVVDKYQQLYFPLAANKKDLEWVTALPSVSNDELNDLLNFSFSVGGGLELYYRPGVAWHKEFILVNTGDATYVNVEGMIEILESEYTKLENKAKAK